MTVFSSCLIFVTQIFIAGKAVFILRRGSDLISLWPHLIANHTTLKFADNPVTTELNTNDKMYSLLMSRVHIDNLIKFNMLQWSKVSFYQTNNMSRVKKVLLHGMGKFIDIKALMIDDIAMLSKP